MTDAQAVRDWWGRLGLPGLIDIHTHFLPPQVMDVAVRLTGPAITEDPRFLDLGVPLEDLAALATDPRLSLTTAQGVVDLGDSVELS